MEGAYVAPAKAEAQRRTSRWLGLPGLLAAALIVTGCQAEPLDPGGTSSTSPTADALPSPSSEAEQNPLEGRQPVSRAFFGMHDALVGQGVTPDVALGSLRFWDTGTTWLQVEPTPGVFDWSAVDSAVNAAEAKGAEPLLVLGQTPTFHASRPAQTAFYGNGAASAPDMKAWRRYVTAAAERYGDRIEYQVWNEANVSGFWSGSPAKMLELTEATAQVLGRVAPEATLVAPAFAMRLKGQQKYFEQFWTLAAQNEAVLDAVDAVSVNLYPAADLQPEDQVHLFEETQRVLDGLDVEAPVWNTEINYGLDGSTYESPLDANQQRAYLVRTYLINAGFGVERVYWYSWRLSGIVNTYLVDPQSGQTTAAGQSFELLDNWLRGAVVAPCGPSPEIKGAWACQAGKGRRDLTFLWKPGVPVTVAVPGSAYRTVEGERRGCGGTCRLKLGETPVLILE